MNDISWSRTIAANLDTYLPEVNTVVPERLIGYGREHSGVQREIVLVVDQSSSMDTSAVYAGIFDTVLASIKSITTHLVVYGTAVVDLTDQLSAPVEVIFGPQLGGGTDTSRALACCETLVRNPLNTVVVLISDVYDNDCEQMLRRMAQLQRQGVTLVTLLALNDEGTPSFDHVVANTLTAMGVPGVRLHARRVPGTHRFGD